MESGSIRNPGSTHFLDNWIPSMKIVNIPPHFWSYVRTNSAYFWRENSNISNSWYFDGRIQNYDKNIHFGGKIQIFEKFKNLTEKFKCSKIIHFCAKIRILKKYKNLTEKFKNFVNLAEKLKLFFDFGAKYHFLENKHVLLFYRNFQF